MPKSLTTDVRLRGVALKITPSKYQQVTVLGYKKPLTKDLRRKFGTENTSFRCHYESANEIILDFERFLRGFWTSKLSYCIQWFAY